MSSYKRPGVYVQESSAGVRAIGAAGSSTAAFCGTCERGPMTPVKVSSLAEARTIFGDFLTSSLLMYAIKAFFDEGGAECYVQRQAHYTDPTDASTLVADAASRTLQTSSDAATAGSLTSDDGPFIVDNGWALGLQIDGGGTVTDTISCAAALHTGSVDLDAAPYTPGAEQYLYITADGLTFTVTFANGVAVDAEKSINLINAAATGVIAYSDGTGNLKIRSGKKGTGQSFVIEATSTGALLTGLGLTAGTYTGSGDCADNTAMTAAELVAALTFAGATDSAVGDAYKVTSSTTGVLSTVKVIGASSTAGLLTALGWADQQTGTGAASGGAADDTLTVYFGRKGEQSPGTLGNEYSVKSVLDSKLTLATGAALAANANAGVTTMQLTSIAGLVVGSVIRITNGTNVEYRTLTDVRRVVSGGAVTFHVDFATALVYSYTTVNCALRSEEFTLTVYDPDGTLVETWTQLSMNTDAANYALTLVNDDVSGSDNIVLVDEGATTNRMPATDTAAVLLSGGDDETTGLVAADKIGDLNARTGIYALADFDDFSVLALPGESSVSVLSSALAYAESRMDFIVLIDVPMDLDQDEAVAWRQDSLGSDTSYGAAYWPWAYVADPIGSGSAPTKLIPPSGLVAGLIARVDALPAPERGPWTSPAGSGKHGKLLSVVSMERTVTDSDHETVNPAGINAIRKFKGMGTLVYGARTLSLDVDWQYLSARRAMMFFEVSIIQSFRGLVFRNNNARLWQQMKDAVDAFLASCLRLGAMPATKKDEAFFIQIGIPDGVMDQSDVDNGIVRGKIGIALNKPGEFLVFDFQQYKGSASASE